MDGLVPSLALDKGYEMLKIVRLVSVMFLVAVFAGCAAAPSEREALHMFLHGE